jgi:hypothetical protein
MAPKNKKNADAEPRTPTAVEAPLPFEARMKAGDFSSARSLANAALADGASPPQTRERAQAVLDAIGLDKGQFALWGVMVLVLLGVFVRSIVVRNDELAKMPSHHDVNKAIIQLQPSPSPSPAPVPAETP